MIFRNSPCGPYSDRIQKKGELPQSLYEMLPSLEEKQKAAFFHTLPLFDQHLLGQLKRQLHPTDIASSTIQPAKVCVWEDKNRALGEKALTEGRVAAVVLAGGMASRLGSDQPKGCFPISPLRGKSLYQLLGEKVVAASMKYGQLLPLILFLSPKTVQATLHHFQEHDYFGMKQEQFFFAIQEELPLLTLEGEPFLFDDGSIALGPDGNGHLFKVLEKAGILSSLQQSNIEFLSLLPIDNPLALPFDQELISFHLHHQAEISGYAIERQNPDEKMGLFVQRDQALSVVEYSEIQEKDRMAQEEDGRLLHRAGNCNLFMINLSFAQATAHLSLPLHIAHKKARALSRQGTTIVTQEISCYKFERFFFDLLPYAKELLLLSQDRGHIFHPLKERNGPFGQEAVKKALSAKDRFILQQLTGKKIPEASLELSASCYYPLASTLATLSSLEELTGYVHPTLDVYPLR